jgi:hypothetical protein
MSNTNIAQPVLSQGFCNVSGVDVIDVNLKPRVARAD